MALAEAVSENIKSDVEEVATACCALVASLLIGTQGDVTRALRLLDGLEGDEIQKVARTGILRASNALGEHLAAIPGWDGTTEPF